MTTNEIYAVCERYGVTTSLSTFLDTGWVWIRGRHIGFHEFSTMTPSEFENLVLLYVLEGTFTQ